MGLCEPCSQALRCDIVPGMIQPIPMPVFTEHQLKLAEGCTGHLKTRAHHKVPVPDKIVVTAMEAAVNAVAEYAAKFGVHMPRWHELGARRYEETGGLVRDLLALELNMAQDDPLAVVFHTTMLFTAAPLFKEDLKEHRKAERRAHRRALVRREATVHVRAYSILQRHHAAGIRIGHLAMHLYDLGAPALPNSSHYTRTQGVLQHLQSLGRAQTLSRGVWTWKRTPEEEAELAKLRAEAGIDEPDGPPPQPGDPPVPGLVRLDGSPQPPAPPPRELPTVTVMLPEEEEIPEEDDS